MSPDAPKCPVPIFALLEPPAGLTDEWQWVFSSLANPITVATSFYSFPDAHQQPLEALTQWLSALRRMIDGMRWMLPYLHGRAPRTWTVGHAIDNAIFPIHARLGSVVGFLTHPLPVNLEPEAQAAPSRARLGEARGTDFRPLLEELATAVVAECRTRLDLPGTILANGAKPAAPFIPLTSWSEIIASLNKQHGSPVLKNDAQTQAKIRKLNEEHKGPIVMPTRKGGQPQVAEDALIEWWNGLREHFDARKQQAEQDGESAKLNVSDTHNYGPTGTVVPEIGGHVKEPRRPE